MTKDEKLNLILSVIGDDWVTYRQIHGRLKHKISIGGISKLIWDNIDEIRDKIEWESEKFGEKYFQQRMIFKKINK
jgi:hypothetical protein